MSRTETGACNPVGAVKDWMYTSSPGSKSKFRGKTEETLKPSLNRNPSLLWMLSWFCFPSCSKKRQVINRELRRFVPNVSRTWWLCFTGTFPSSCAPLCPKEITLLVFFITQDSNESDPTCIRAKPCLGKSSRIYEVMSCEDTYYSNTLYVIKYIVIYIEYMMYLGKNIINSKTSIT